MFQHCRQFFVGLSLLGALLSVSTAQAQQEDGLSVIPSIPNYPVFSDSNGVAFGELLGQDGEVLYVEVTKVRYATGLLNGPAGAAAGPDEKLFEIMLKVENRGAELDNVAAGRLDIRVTDQSDRSYEKIVYLGPGAGSEQKNIFLEPGEEANVVAALLIPATSLITTVRIRDAVLKEEGLRVPVTCGDYVPVVLLPASISEYGSDLPAILDGRAGVWYALAQSDIRLVDFEVHESTAYGVNASETAPLLAAIVEVRNRGTRQLRVHKGLLRQTAASFPSGERAPLWRVVDELGSRAGVLLQSNETLRRVLLFRVPPGPAPRDIMLVESNGGRGGIPSHSYRVPLESSAAENSSHAEGVLASGRLAAQEATCPFNVPSLGGISRDLSNPLTRLGDEKGPGLGVRESVVAYYTLGLPSIEPGQAAKADEKVINLKFDLQNLEDYDIRINDDQIKVTFEDTEGVRHGDTELRHEYRLSTIDHLITRSARLRVHAVANIPADLEIRTAYISGSRAEWEHEIPLHDIGRLPASISADGLTVEPSVAGMRGIWYPLATIDVRMNSWSPLEDGLADYPPSEQYDYVVVDLSVRNRSNQELRLHKGLFRGTTLIFDDIWSDARSLWFQSGTRNVDFPMLPGQEIDVRMLYRLPKDAQASEFRVLEKTGSRGGAPSRRYDIDLDGASPGLLSTATVGIEQYEQAGIAPSWDMIDMPSIGDPTGRTPGVVTLPSDEVPDAVEVPDGVIPQELPKE